MSSKLSCNPELRLALNFLAVDKNMTIMCFCRSYGAFRYGVSQQRTSLYGKPRGSYFSVRNLGFATELSALAQRCVSFMASARDTYAVIPIFPSKT